MSMNDYYRSAYGKASEEEKNTSNKLAIVLFAKALDAGYRVSEEERYASKKIYEAMFEYARLLLENGWTWFLDATDNPRSRVYLDFIPEIANEDSSFTRSGWRARKVGMLNKTDGRMLLANTDYSIRGGEMIQLVSFFEGRSFGLSGGYIDSQDFTKAPTGDRVKLDEFVRLDVVLSILYGFEVKPECRKKAQNSMTDTEVYLNLAHFFGNGIEEILRLNSAQENPWLYRVLCEGVYPGRPYDGGSLKKLLGINKNDLKYFLSQEKPDRLLFYMLAKQKNGMSVSEAMKTYDRIIKINDKYELDKEYDDHFYRWDDNKNIRIYGDRGRRILASKGLPRCLQFYSAKRLGKVISVSKYLRYLIDERKKNKDIDLEELETDLDDYNRMLKEVLPNAAGRFELPYNIVNAHNTMVVNYNAVRSEGGTNIDTVENVEKLCRNYNDFWNTYSDDKFLVKRPLLPSDIHREGSVLNHCVGTYTNRVLSGGTHIFFVRKKSAPDKPLVTLEVSDDGRILQQRGKGNRVTTPEESDFIAHWASAYRANMLDWRANNKRRENIFNDEALKIIAKMQEDKENVANKIREELANVTYAKEDNAASL